MDNEQERNEHFKGFAELLYEELVSNAATSEKGLSDIEAFKQEQYQIIAQRAYDLVSFAVYKSMRGCSLAQIPDITEWSTLTEDRKFDVD